MKKLLITFMIILLAITGLFAGNCSEGVDQMGFGIQSIEDAIVEKVSTDITVLKVEGFPDKPDNYQLNHPKGAVLIRYVGTRGSESIKGVISESINKINQKLTLYYEATILTKSLRGNAGAYDVLDQMKSSLVGYLIDGCDKMQFVEDGFIDESSGKWEYKMTFAIKTGFIETEGV